MTRRVLKGTATYTLGLIFTLHTLGCSGAEVLRKEIDEARRERDVLRDAYESQQLRLRELESRLLQLEDQGSPTYSSVSARSPNQPRLSSKQMFKKRLRALPVVMVKQSVPLDEISQRDRSRTKSRPMRATSQPERSSSKRITANSKRSKRKTPPRRDLGAESKRTPTLTANNISQYKSEEEREAQIAQSTSGATKSYPVSVKAPSLESQESTVAATSPKSSSAPITPKPKVSNLKAADAESLLLSRAKTARANGQRDRAVRLLKRLISENPTHALIPDALYQMGRLQIEQGQERLGRSTLVRLSRLYPNAKAAEAAKRYLKANET